jgi:hypothetical protein
MHGIPSPSATDATRAVICAKRIAWLQRCHGVTASEIAGDGHDADSWLDALLGGLGKPPTVEADVRIEFPRA